jgi:hypothetical protein
MWRMTPLDSVMRASSGADDHKRLSGNGVESRQNNESERTASTAVHRTSY